MIEVINFFKKALSGGKIKDDQMCISKAGINAMACWGLSEWGRRKAKLQYEYKGWVGSLNIWITFPLHPTPPSPHLIIESPDWHICLQLSTVSLAVLGISELFFFYPVDILRQLETSRFHTGTLQHSWEDP